MLKPRKKATEATQYALNDEITASLSEQPFTPESLAKRIKFANILSTYLFRLPGANVIRVLSVVLLHACKHNFYNVCEADITDEFVVTVYNNSQCRIQ